MQQAHTIDPILETFHECCMKKQSLVNTTCVKRLPLGTAIHNADINSDTFNICITHQPTSDEVYSQVISSIMQLYGTSRFAWWQPATTPQQRLLLQQHGFIKSEEAVGMQLSYKDAVKYLQQLQRNSHDDFRAVCVNSSVEMMQQYSELQRSVFVDGGQPEEAEELSKWYVKLDGRRAAKVAEWLQFVVGYNSAGVAVTTGALYCQPAYPHGGYTALIADIATSPQHRKQGYGTAMVTHLIASAVQQMQQLRGHQSYIYLLAEEGVEAWYEAIGFRVPWQGAKYEVWTLVS